MNHINVSTAVGSNTSTTVARLEGFFHEYAPQAEMTFALRAPFDIAALRVGLTLQREVSARFAPLGSDSHAYAVAWEPVMAGPFPSFAGTIYVTTDEFDATKSIVTLDGHYHPPLGAAGDVFDAVLGKHIAQASAADLVQRIAAYIEQTPAPVSVFA